uniref:uncharacterized protein isoform X2 n=1 Tax=Myxine glutinosa TaxID=7769 RepID=UPI00358FBA78
MVNNCAVFGCSNRSNRDKKSYFLLPSVITGQGDKTKELTEKRRARWIANLRRECFTPSKHTRICSDHFISGKAAKLYDTTNPDWIPTVNMGRTKMSGASPSNPQRTAKRVQKRKRLHTSTAHLSFHNYNKSLDAPGSSSLENGKPADLHDQSNPQWAPTLNIGYSTISKPPASAAMSRFERNIRRNQKKIAVAAAESLLDLRHRPKTQIRRRPKSLIKAEDSRVKREEVQKATEEDSAAVTMKISVGMQTESNDLTPKMARMMRDELQRLITENMNLRSQLQDESISPVSFEQDKDKVKFYTGLPSYITLMTVFSLIEPFIPISNKITMTAFQKYVLVLMKLKMNLHFQDLAYRFRLSKPMVSKTFRSVINIMFYRLKSLIFWPEREVLQKTMPMDFRQSFGDNVVVVIDSFEILIDKPSNLLARSQTWSSCKHHNTVKFLIGMAPQGMITFLSKSWGGRTSDGCITASCGLLDRLLPQDIVLSGRAYDVSKSTGHLRTEPKVLTFRKGDKQLCPVEVESTNTTAHVHMRVERVLRFLRNKYTILGGLLPIDFVMCDAAEADVPLIDKIVTVCCALMNVCESVVRFK